MGTMEHGTPAVERDGDTIAGSRVKLGPELGQYVLDILEGDVRAYRVLEKAVQDFPMVMVHLFSLEERPAGRRQPGGAL